MAIRAVRRLGRVIERSRALSRNAAGLPIVVLVKAAQPAVLIHGLIEMHFVARGAKFRRFLAHERLHERAAMRLGVQIGDECVELANKRILLDAMLMQRRILDRRNRPCPIVLPTCTMEWHETQPRPFCASGVSTCSLIGRSKRPLKKTAWSWQPAHHLLPLDAAQFLHVKDGGFVERIVERREVVHGALPLLVDVFVTFTAELRIHEEIGRNHVPVLVRDDDGQNGVPGPAPSSLASIPEPPSDCGCAPAARRVAGRAPVR